MKSMNVPGYESLQSVLTRAYDQAARNKGAERHANNLPFDKQPMQTIAANRGVGFLLGQADKKSQEAGGMINRNETDRAVHELLGAINYLAGSIIYLEGQVNPTEDKEKECDCPACEARRKIAAVLGVSIDQIEVSVAVESDDEDKPTQSLQDLLTSILKRSQ